MKYLSILLLLLAGCSNCHADETTGNEITPDYSPAQSITIIESKGKIATIDWSTGKVKFTGDVDESAKIFFDYMYNEYINQGQQPIKFPPYRCHEHNIMGTCHKSTMTFNGKPMDECTQADYGFDCEPQESK